MAIAFEARLPKEVPAAAAVYEVPRVRIGSSHLRETAKSLGLRGVGGDIVTSTDVLAYNEARYRLEVQRASGGIAFYHRDKYGRDPEKDFRISDRRVAALALEHLRKTKIVPPQATRLAGISKTHSAAADTKTRELHERITDATAVYRRVIDDLVVEGPGGFIAVTLDPDAEVIAVRSVWRPAGRRLGRVKLSPPDEGLSALEEHVAQLRGDVVVTKATIGYFELGPLDRQLVIEPAYAFVYVVRYNEVAMKSAFVVHAGEKTFGQLIGKKRFPAPVRPRRQR